MKKFKKIVSMFSVLVMLMSLCLSSSASAANVCYDVRGNLTQTVTFKVDVGKKIFSSEKIVLTQTQGITRQGMAGRKDKNVGMYGRFYVSVYDNTDGEWVYSNQKWKSKTFTIKSSKLKKKHSYIITVSGDMKEYLFDTYNYTPYSFETWLSYPTWSATKTGGNVNFCGY